jgi:hypothetical protein
MKAISISKASWHYRFVDLATDFEKNIDDGKIHADICTYTRYFLKAIFKSLFLGVAGLVFTSILLSPLVYLIAHLLGYVDKMWTVAGVGLCLWIFMVGAITVAFIQNGYSRLKEKRALAARPPGILKTMYRHLHDKTCAKLNIE